MAKIDKHYILVESENPSYPVDVTEQPVEKGVNLTDHVQRQARTMGVSGYVVGPDAAKVLAYLRKASDTGKIVKYVGRIAFSGVITELATTHTYSIANGYSISFMMREIRIAKASRASKLPAPVRSQAALIVKAGTKKQKKKGAGKTKIIKSTSKEKTQKVKFKPGSKWAT
ncbi:phage baseplate protein [Paenibacillus popilliae]|uniref:Dit-like phage tail protein N-terminal domain-containing protein n=1 Tax=Paenibacillus popilliae ATCC 14706 TaxID=1212764 RepID=M9LGL5_PAEPP|nr:hypothetical protein [Paenibacillus popilliae]GAC41700.1 hypothetical protein PPOP_1051 [Paenibacillus popilliae ATCC 14706]